MIYFMSDIHGCYDEYMELLKKIHFCEEDELYVLGDVMDRGPEPMKVVQDMMMRSNVYLILGNHDYMALKTLKKLNVQVTADNVRSHLSQQDILDYFYWKKDGGETTAKTFGKLSAEEKAEILGYLEDASLYEEISVNGKIYRCVHGDIHGACDGKELEDHGFTDFLFHRAQYERRYYSDEKITVVTGHTPTMLLNEDGGSEIYEANGHLAIDCGCVYGKQLGVYCANNGQVTYVQAKQRYW